MTRPARILAIGSVTLAMLAATTLTASAQSADPTAVTPAWITGTLELAPERTNPTSTSEAGVVRERHYRCGPQTWTASDPRLSGAATKTWNADVFDVAGGVSVSAGTYDLRNDAGAWHCTYADRLAHGSGLFTASDNDETITCVGSEGYEGLSAILVLDWTVDPVTITGLIFQGEVPPLP